MSTTPKAPHAIKARSLAVSSIPARPLTVRSMLDEPFLKRLKQAAIAASLRTGRNVCVSLTMAPVAIEIKATPSGIKEMQIDLTREN